MHLDSSTAAPPPAAGAGLRRRLGAVLAGLLALSTACHRPVVAPPAAPAAPAPTRPALVEAVAVGWQPRPDLAGVSCTDGACVALAGGRLWRVDVDSLELGEDLGPRAATALADHGGPVLVLACPDGPCVEPLVDDAAPRAGAPPAAVPRAPFAAQLTDPEGGRIALFARPSPRLMRTGGGTRFMALPPVPGEARYLRALALHPSGREAYALPWPGDTLLAFDPVGLQPRWRVALRGAAQGLYVEPRGRLLVAEEGGATDPERVLDLGTDAPALPPGGDAGSDLFLALAERPDARATALVDLAQAGVVWRQDGRYLSLHELPDGTWLLATTGGLARLRLPSPPPSP